MEVSVYNSHDGVNMLAVRQPHCGYDIVLSVSGDGHAML